MLEELHLSKYQASYSEENNRINPPEFKPLVLAPPRRKQTFAPEVNPSTIITNELTFGAG